MAGDVKSTDKNRNKNYLNNHRGEMVTAVDRPLPFFVVLQKQSL